jgi:hypothetical protein
MNNALPQGQAISPAVLVLIQVLTKQKRINRSSDGTTDMKPCELKEELQDCA